MGIGHMETSNRRVRRLWVTAATLLLTVGVVAPAAADGPDGGDAADTGQVIVRYRDGAGDGIRAMGADGAGSTAVRAVPAGTTAAAEAQRLEQDPAVAYAEPDYRVELFAEPSQSDQWGLENTGQSVLGTDGTPDLDVDGTAAWETTTGSRDVVVAVIDTGIDTDHPDLGANVWTNRAEANGTPGVDDDGNGFVDDVHGWDFVNDDDSVFDSGESFHGTHVAGTVAAPRNGRGVAGVAPGVRVMPLKFVDGESGAVSNAVEAIEYAAAMGADVINASWGTVGNSRALREAIVDAGLPVAAAAGNAGRDLDTDPVYPAAFDLGEVLGVAAVDNRGGVPSFSNHGGSTVEVAGPGAGVLSLMPDGRYGYANGTSMAAPHVSGIAALLASEDPGLSAAQINDRIAGSVTPLASLADRTVTGGLVNAAAALAAGGSQSGTDDGGSDDSDDGSHSSQSTDGSSGDGDQTDAAGEACPADRVPSASFDDVPESSVHHDNIDCVAWWELTSGVAPGRYGPGQSLTRGQMARFITDVLRASGAALPGDVRDAFRDDDGIVHETAINTLAALGIVDGVGDGRYEPRRTVTRAQMAAYLVGTAQHLSGEQLPTGTDHFRDDDGTVHEDAINAARGAGMADGVSDRRFDPHGAVRRDQMASFLAGLLDQLVAGGSASVPS